MGEMLEQSDGVGKGLVEGEQVGVAGLEEIAMQPVQESMRRFVSDDVKRLTCEHGSARQSLTARVFARREVAEQ